MTQVIEMEKNFRKKLKLRDGEENMSSLGQFGRVRDCKDSDFEEKGKKFGEKLKECKRIIFKVSFFEVIEIQFTDMGQQEEHWGKT